MRPDFFETMDRAYHSFRRKLVLMLDLGDYVSMDFLDDITSVFTNLDKAYAVFVQTPSVDTGGELMKIWLDNSDVLDKRLKAELNC